VSFGAQIFTRLDAIVLDGFSVTDAATGGLVGRESREKFEEILYEALTKPGFDLEGLIARRKTRRPPYQGLEGERIATRVYFDNNTTGNRTAIEVETEDRLGLLFHLSEALTAMGIPIFLAKIATEMGAAIDTFYVCGPDGQKIATPEAQRDIEERLRAAAAR